MKTALNIHVTGIVQGVGFRPFVYKQAKHYLIDGWVLNCSDGVHIHAQGDEKLVDEFCLSLANDAPAASDVKQIDMKEVPLKNYKDFEIRFSKDENLQNDAPTLVSPDLATCNDCVKELCDSTNRRYRYPFINCTNCGPRFTIIKRLPYDRCNTSMDEFTMCKDCNHEYTSPLDRRFHAQPNACFECGPKVSFTKDRGKNIIWGTNRELNDNIFAESVKFLKQGKILAVKGLGGFHLVCDACNNKAAENLRKRKERSNKAFAIMSQNINNVKVICRVNDTEEKLLTSPSAPIVLLKRNDSNIIAPSVINGLPEIGVMLPYTPVQHLLLHDFCEAGGKYLVMTSGNIYDNPIVTDDQLAYKVLGDVADAFLGNNREILNRYDDSVIRILNASNSSFVQFIRRARSYAPRPIKLNNHFTNIDKDINIFATGPEQKNTFCYLRVNKEAEAFVGQHIGDVENADVFNAWLQAKSNFQSIFDFNDNVIACDMHPQYLTTKWAREQERNNYKEKSLQGNSTPKSIVYVQHHYAHILSVMAENNLEGPVAGFSFDGTGYGVDKNIWGGELLICNYNTFERFANFCYISLPGGVAAIKEPLRITYSALWNCDLLHHPACSNVFKDYDSDFKLSLGTMIENGINSPLCSSVGRLFDAVSALLGICVNPTYEGEAAIMLEAVLSKDAAFSKANKDVLKRYVPEIIKNVATKNSTAQDTSVLVIDPKKTFKAILDDINSGLKVNLIAKNFHDAIILTIINLANIVNQYYDIKTFVCTGGVFMNRYIIENTIEQLTFLGFDVAINNQVPPNDGGVSLGQAVYAANKDNV